MTQYIYYYDTYFDISMGALAVRILLTIKYRNVTEAIDGKVTKRK